MTPSELLAKSSFDFLAKLEHQRLWCSPGKNYWLESVAFLLKSIFYKKNNDSKLHMLFLHHINDFKKNIVEEILKNLQFFSTYLLTHFPSHTCMFKRVAKLVHKYTELANKNKIFSAVSGNTDKNYSDRGRSS